MMPDAWRDERPKVGRPTKLDDLLAKRICDSVAAGNTRRCAAQAAGIAYSTLKEWVRRGDEGEEPFAAFLARLEKADGEAEERHVRNIETAAARGSWQASAWWLERRRRYSGWRRPAPLATLTERRPTLAADENLEAAARASQEQDR
jgi:hypothetical protein